MRRIPAENPSTASRPRVVPLPRCPGTGRSAPDGLRGSSTDPASGVADRDSPPDKVFTRKAAREFVHVTGKPKRAGVVHLLTDPRVVTVAERPHKLVYHVPGRRGRIVTNTHVPKHAWYPKDMSAYPGLRWRYHGAWKFLVVDRASHYSGGDIHVAGMMLGFEIDELPPARPELKGGVESSMRPGPS